MNLDSKQMWTPAEIKTLRQRMGWSQAEMARSLKLELTTVTGWEAGRTLPKNEDCHGLVQILRQVENHSEKMRNRPLAEMMMRTQGLSQIHELEVAGIPEALSPRR